MIKIFKLLVFFFTFSYALSSDISIEKSSIRMMPPGSNVTAGYFLISNNSNKDIVLTGVTSSKFNAIEMHNIIEKNNVLAMVKQESIIIPANSKLEFKPMSYHLMLMGPSKQFTENEKIDITFKIKNNNSITKVFLVKKNKYK